MAQPIFSRFPRAPSIPFSSPSRPASSSSANEQKQGTTSHEHDTGSKAEDQHQDQSAHAPAHSRFGLPAFVPSVPAIPKPQILNSISPIAALNHATGTLGTVAHAITAETSAAAGTISHVAVTGVEVVLAPQKIFGSNPAEPHQDSEEQSEAQPQLQARHDLPHSRLGIPDFIQNHVPVVPIQLPNPISVISPTAALSHATGTLGVVAHTITAETSAAAGTISHVAVTGVEVVLAPQKIFGSNPAEPHQDSEEQPGAQPQLQARHDLPHSRLGIPDFIQNHVPTVPIQLPNPIAVISPTAALSHATGTLGTVAHAITAETGAAASTISHVAITGATAVLTPPKIFHSSSAGQDSGEQSEGHHFGVPSFIHDHIPAVPTPHIHLPNPIPALNPAATLGHAVNALGTVTHAITAETSAAAHAVSSVATAGVKGVLAVPSAIGPPRLSVFHPTRYLPNIINPTRYFPSIPNPFKLVTSPFRFFVKMLLRRSALVRAALVVVTVIVLLVAFSVVRETVFLVGLLK